MAEPATAVHQLIHAGRAAALAGDTFAARSSFRRATELDPTSAEAWLGLSGVVPILAEKRAHLLRVLDLAPDHSEARASLAYVERLLAEGLKIAPAQRREERTASGDASPLLAASEPTAPPAVETLVCYRHPDRETGLHCVQCSRPICGQCATISSVGQLCPECVKARRPANYQVGASQIVIALVVGMGVGALANVVLPLVLGIPFMGLILAMVTGPLAGEGVYRAVERLTRGKRGRPMQIAAGSGLAAGIAPTLVFSLLAVFLMGSIGALLTAGLVGLWLALAIGTVARRLQ